MATHGKKRITSSNSDDTAGGIVARVTRAVSESPIARKAGEVVGEASYVAKRLAKSTGKAAWMAGTTFLILVVPLIIEMDREQQLTELELQQQSLLGPPPPTK